MSYLSYTINIIGLWMSAESIGKFLGPIVGGILVESSSFRHTTLFFFVVYLIELFLTFFSAIKTAKKVNYPLQTQKSVGESTDTETLITKWINNILSNFDL